MAEIEEKIDELDSHHKAVGDVYANYKHRAMTPEQST
jgi:hypothetical protein